MDEIRSWWEVPCIAHFCYIFRKPFKLPEFEIEELEDTLLLDCAPTPSALLVELFCTFLNGIVDKEITEDNWPFFLKLHMEWRCEYLKEKWNPFSENKEYKDLTIRERVEILHKLCHWRLELDDIADLLRGLDGPSLRLEPMGRDSEGNHYWYFFGVRLYKEEPKRKKKEKDKENGPTSAKKAKGKGGATPKNTPTSKKKSTPANSRTPATGRRGNTRGRGSNKKQEAEESDNEEKAEAPEEKEGGRESVERGSNGVSAVSTTGWHVVCNNLEEWEELVENLGGTKHQETRRLIRTLQEYLPDIERNVQLRDRQYKKKMLAEMPRRTSDRIAIKAAQRIEEERLEASAREEQRLEFRRLQAEEERARQEEADEKRRRKHDEAIQRRKQKQEEQARVRREEEENWEKALSGELSGPRKAAIGAAEGVSDTQRLSEELQLQLVADRDEDLYTAMFKILNCLRGEEDAWVFEEPVTESIAPGYFDVVNKPMDYSTVEKKIENNSYKCKEEFVTDIELIFQNCCAYNGDDSEYSELAVTTKKAFGVFCKKHFEGEEPMEEGGANKGKKSRKKRDSRSPSACKTPELTSESSSEEEESDDSDESYEDGKKPAKKAKGPQLKLSQSLQNKLTNLTEPGTGMGPMMGGPRPPGHMHPGMMPPHFHPNYYQMMQQRFGGMKPMPPGAGDQMGYPRYPQHPHMPPNRLPPPYPGQPHPEMVARQHAMYQGPPPDGRHMYPPTGHFPPHPHGPHPSMPHPPPPHGYPPYPMFPRHPHMPPYPPGPGHGVMRPPQPTSRSPSGGSPVVRSPPLRGFESPGRSRSTSSPTGSNPRQTASPMATGSNPRMTESPAESHSSEQQQQQVPPQLPATPTQRQGQGEEPPGQPEEKDQSSSEQQEREEGGVELPARETVSKEEKPSERSMWDLKPPRAGSDAKDQPVNPTAAEMLHRQQIQHQQEYQRYRYHQQLMALHHHRHQRDGSSGYGPYLPQGYDMPPPPHYPPPGPGSPMGHGGPMPNHGGQGPPVPNHGGSVPGGAGEREREAAAAYYWHQQQMYGGHDPRQLAEQQRYWQMMEMRKRQQHMAAMMKQQKMAQQQRHHQGGHTHQRTDGTAHPRPDGTAPPRPEGSAYPARDGITSSSREGSSHPHQSDEGQRSSAQAVSGVQESGSESEDSHTSTSKDGHAATSKDGDTTDAGDVSNDSETVATGRGEKLSRPTTNSVDKKTKGEGELSDADAPSNQQPSEQKGSPRKFSELAEKLSSPKQNKMSHSHSNSRVPHSHSAAPGYGPPGPYGGPMTHGSPPAMPNGYMDPSMGGYPSPHAGMYPHHPPYPHMDPAAAGMDYRNGLGGPGPHYPPAPGFYPPPHQRMPYYPSPPHSGGMPPHSGGMPPHSGGMSPYQMPPHHHHYSPQAQGHPHNSEGRRSMPISNSGLAMSMSDQPGAMLAEGKTRPAPSTSPLEEAPPSKRSRIES